MSCYMDRQDAERLCSRMPLQGYVPISRTLAKCLAEKAVFCTQEVGAAFINVSAPSIVSGMSGESEKTLRETFEEAAVSFVSHRHGRNWLKQLDHFAETGTMYLVHRRDRCYHAKTRKRATRDGKADSSSATDLHGRYADWRSGRSEYAYLTVISPQICPGTRQITSPS